MKPVSLVHYGDISANLDQAMSKKNKNKNKNKEEKKAKKKKTKKIHAKIHSSLGLTGPNFAFGRNF